MPDENGYLSGVEGFVLKDGIPMPFGEWALDFGKSGTPDVSNWKTAPYGYVVPGMHKATISLKGPYQYGQLALRNLGKYTFNLGYFPGVYLSVIAVVKLKLSNSAEGSPMVDVSGETCGPMSILVV